MRDSTKTKDPWYVIAALKSAKFFEDLAGSSWDYQLVLWNFLSFSLEIPRSVRELFNRDFADRVMKVISRLAPFLLPAGLRGLYNIYLLQLREKAKEKERKRERQDVPLNL